MAKSDPIEYEKRIRIVQEWILEEYPYCDIVNQSITKWELSERQARRYIAEGKKRWLEESQEVLDDKRRLKIQGFKKLKRSLQEKYRGTPSGILTIIAVDKMIIELEGIKPIPGKSEPPPAGADIYSDLKDDELKKLLETTLQKLGNE